MVKSRLAFSGGLTISKGYIVMLLDQFYLYAAIHYGYN